MIDVSVIIVNYHSAELVIECINSIIEKTEDICYEIIVIDNASGDGSVQKLQNKFGERITVIGSEVNLGFGKANNLGNTYAKGEYLFFLNPDTILVNNAIKILHDALIENPDYGVVGGNLFMPDMSPAPSYCMKFDVLKDEKKSASWRYIISQKVKDKLGIRKGTSFENKFNDTEYPMSVAYIFGADIMVNKRTFDMIGGFDPDFFMYYEEEELTWRITDAEYKVMSIPNAKIIHLDGATTKEQNTFSENQFRMRMNGALTYYDKLYGTDGVRAFFELRCKRYCRLIKIAKIQHKFSEDFIPAVQKKCLEEEYRKYTL